MEICLLVHYIINICHSAMTYTYNVNDQNIIVFMTISSYCILLENIFIFLFRINNLYKLAKQVYMKRVVYNMKGMNKVATH